MRILVADDDQVGAFVLAHAIEQWGHETVVAHDGDEAWTLLQRDPTIEIGVIDWMMPGLEGPEVCRRLRADTSRPHVYVILLTGREGQTDLVAGLGAGADDYVVKPFDSDELRARLQVGVRMITLQRSLADRVRELEAALDSIKQLTGLLPICSYCKRIRGDENYWEQVESYIAQHSAAQFTHGICPDCFEAVRASLEGGTNWSPLPHRPAEPKHDDRVSVDEETV